MRKEQRAKDIQANARETGGRRITKIPNDFMFLGRVVGLLRGLAVDLGVTCPILHIMALHAKVGLLKRPVDGATAAATPQAVVMPEESIIDAENVLAAEVVEESTPGVSSAADKTEDFDQLDNEFETAVETAKHLSKEPSSDVKLQLYGLYKQATVGPCSSPPPTGMFDVVGKAKHRAWSQLGSMNTEMAKVAYIQLVNKLKLRN